METAKAVNAPQNPTISWHAITWVKAYQQVRKIQIRLVKAVKMKRWRRVRSLQRLLTRSLAAKQLAVRQVLENDGKRTAGIDGQLWETAEAKTQAIYKLKGRGYQAKPLKRVYIPKTNGEKRPLGIPTLHDRAMQALWKMALEPLAETLADENSYGFRVGRSAMDAIEHCHSPILARRISPEWILDADIQGCFDNINHEWLLHHIPMNKRILKQWLRAGYMERLKFHPTRVGTPQGGIISPIIANMALDGLGKQLKLNFKRSQKAGLNDKVNMIRYADDFIITGITAELIKEQVIPVVGEFLKARGLKLSETKTRVKHISEGFDFLGFNLRKYPCGKVLTTPSQKSQKNFKQTIKILLKQMRAESQATVIARLRPVITGWANYFRYAASKTTFAKLDHWLWGKLWAWCRRRHLNKSKRWIKSRYFHTYLGKNWIFGCQEKQKSGKTIFRHIPKMASIIVTRYKKIKRLANPYDPEFEEYFERRLMWKMQTQLQGMKNKLWNKQKGKCLYCDQWITEITHWHIHHQLPRCKGGQTILKNLMLLHPLCHQQIHHRETAGLSVPDNFIHA